MKKILLSILSICFAHTMYSQIPMLNSKPSVIHKVLYLDFDGQVVIGTPWNSSTSNPTITALPSTLSSAAMLNIWKRMAEDFMPFDVNLTTDVAKFNAATPNSRMRIVITPSSAWYPSSVGGVAYLNSFTWGGNPDTPCWVFENALGYSAKNCAEAGSHEAGHTLSLKHQSIWNGSCAKTAEYHGGIGSGVTSWAPIMGVGYSKNVTIWHRGTNSNTCTTIQFDHGSNGITGAAFLNYTLDDVGNTLATGKTINTNTTLLVDSGMITTPTDVDVFKFSICNNRYMTFNIKPWALDTTAGVYDAADLDIRFQLFNATTTASLAIDTPLAKLNTLVGINLPAGSYYFVIDGGGSANYSDYGSLGRYYMRITSNNIPTIASAFTTNSVLCSGTPINFTDASTGSPNTWNWALTGASPATSTVSNPSATYNTAGIYTVSLVATNGTLTSCGVTQTIMVNASPTISTLNSSPICVGNSANISASGATSYVWNTSSTSASIVVSPTLTTTYTVTGTVAGCSNTSTLNVLVHPLPNVTATSINSLICDGEAAVIIAGGATSYVWNTSATSQSITVTPTVTTLYTVTGTDINGCVNTATYNLIVSWCAGVNELNPTDSDFSIYPNPSEGMFFIKTSLTTEHDVMIVNSLGQVIQKTKLTSDSKVDLTKETNGIYQIIILDNGKAVFSTKVIRN
ncbi:MAG: T9SS type A sorting domain-containing protein [Bacteroidia bacterium]|jgi:PKD repeat protein|nr:T9SS type A sorting domain-containing protein [Bacteroidia bacterium]